MLEWSRVLLSSEMTNYWRILMVGVAILAIPNLSLSAKQDSSKQNSQPNWPAPTKLISQLESLENNLATKKWATTTKQLVTVFQDTSQDVAKRRITLQQIIKQRDELQPLAQSIYQQKQADSAAIASELIRMQYRMTRRIDVWQVLLNKPVKHTLKDSLSPGIGYRRLAFEGLPTEWIDYLLLRDFRTVFEGVAHLPEERRALARQMLARIYSPALTQDQRSYAQSIFADDVIQFLKSHASESIDDVDLLKRLENHEYRNTARSAYTLNQRYQDAFWSSDPDERELATILDTHYRNANFRLTVSQQFMNRLLPQLPSISEPVSEQVNGALLSGESHVTNNKINVDLIPDPNQLNFHIQTQGEVFSDTMARVKSVRIFSQGLAWFHVTKPVMVSRDGIDASQEAYSVSRAQQFLVDIQSNADNMPVIGNLVRRATENRVREESPSTNQLFRRRVVQEAEARVEEILGKQISKVKQNAQANLLQPLLNFDLEPEPVQLATTDEKVIIRYRLAGRDQMGAYTSRPTDEPGSLLNFQLHKSLINNAVSRLGLNGNSFDSQQLVAHLQEVLNIEAKQDASPSQKGKDAVFTFADHDAVHVGFEDNRILITLKFAKLVLKKNARPLRNISMQAAYEVKPEGMQLTLTQDDTGTRIGPRKLRLGERTTVSTVMKVLFKKSYTVNALPKKFRSTQQAQQLAISQLVLSNGWIGVSMRDSQLPATAENQRLPTRLGKIRKNSVLVR